MTLEVTGPFSGRPVKIRPQDVGKAVRDEENRIFYVLPKRDGSGYYGAPTRAGGERDEQRDARYQERMAEARTVNEARSRTQVTTERGKARTGRVIRLVILLLALGAGAAYWFLSRS